MRGRFGRDSEACSVSIIGLHEWEHELLQRTIARISNDGGDSSCLHSLQGLSLQ